MLAIYADEALGHYGYADKPWFLPDVRLQAFRAAFTAAGLDDRVTWRSAPPATDADLCRFHTPAHVERVTRLCAAGEGALDHGATPARPHIERAARHVCGAVLDAAQRIVAGEIRRAYVPIAGFHHAHPELAKMYCLYNDPGVALAWLAEVLDGPVAYVDIDIHQGDGVYAGFAADPRVVIADIHEDWSTLWPHSPEAPGTGDFPGRRADRGLGDGVGTALNVPLAPATDDAGFLAAWAEVEAFVDTARPAFVVFEAGVDGYGGDPMSHQALSLEVFAAVTRRVRALADQHAGGRLLVLGGGGYDPEATAAGWAGVAAALV